MSGTTPPPAPRQITRYENRKLYDVAARAYVTLEQLRARVVAGEDLEVVDQRTGEDLTTLTLAQVLLEGLRGSTARLPRQILARVIRLAFGPAASRDEDGGPPEAMARARQEAERIAGGLLARGRLTLEDATVLRHELGQSVHRLVAEAQAGIEGGLRALLAPSADGPRAALRGLEARLDRFGHEVEKPKPRKPSRARPPASARRP